MLNAFTFGGDLKLILYTISLHIITSIHIYSSRLVESVFEQYLLKLTSGGQKLVTLMDFQIIQFPGPNSCSNFKIANSSLTIILLSG